MAKSSPTGPMGAAGHRLALAYPEMGAGPGTTFQESGLAGVSEPSLMTDEGGCLST
jgi:hypothetical protein